MITIKRKNENKPRTIRADEIPFGTLFSGTQTTFERYNGVFMRTYNGIVSLDKPESWTWDNGSLCYFGFENYVELDGELTVWENKA